MKPIEIVVDSHLRMGGLSRSWQEGLARLCAVENEDKQVAINEHVWGADSLDDYLTLANIDDAGMITLPRGFKDELAGLLDAQGHKYKFINNTTWGYKMQGSAPELHTSKFVLKREQEKALAKMRTHDQGRIIAPPGKGKTVMGLAYACYEDAKTLILVDKKHIAQQWVDNAQKFWEWDIGFIGDNKWDEKDTSVALIQTIYSRRDTLGPEWFNRWDMVMLDEQHHIPAETYTDVVSRFRARKRFGLSATVGKSKSKKRISELVFGPILYETDHSELKPEVKVVSTDFDFGYHPTHKSKIGGKTKVVRNNYQKMINELVKDARRNHIIAHEISKDNKAAHLIVSGRIKHLEAIAAILHNYDIDIQIYFLTGNETLDERMEIYKKSDNANCAVFSTLGVAGEALDIPRLDRIHLAYPMKNEETVWQVIGRGARPHENKDSCIIYDYVDDVGVLEGQYKHRLRKIYQAKELKVNVKEN